MNKTDLKLNKWIYRFLGKKSLRRVFKHNKCPFNYTFNKMYFQEDIEERKFLLKNL